MFKSRQAWLVLGLVLGSIVGLNVAGIWPQIPVHATATHGQDGFAIATGPLSNDIEAVYVLDYLTGDLKAAVLNLQTAKFLTAYQYNVSKDLGGPNGKSPALCDGHGRGRSAPRRPRATWPVGRLRGRVQQRQTGAYALPWTTGRENVLSEFAAPIQPLAIMKFRTVEIRK